MSLMDFLQSASNAAASNVSGPVDLLAFALKKAGIPVDTPLLGSQWMAQKGLTKPVPQNAASLAGETAGLLSPLVAAARAPQIAGGLLRAGENAAIPRQMNPQRGAIVYHGSPHKFDAFDSSKIGTGEGAQAYGHGLYLADSPDVARTYSADRAYVGAAMSGKPVAINYDDPVWIAQKTIDELGDPAKAKAHLEMVARTAAKHQTPEAAAAVKGAIDLIAAGGVKTKGALYKVDLPDEQIAKMLDWDKPLSQQAPEVQELARRAGIVDPNGEIGGVLGKGLYEALGDGKVSAATAEKLRKQGIPGIRYLDGGSRGAGQGTSNYVVFPGNENLLRILERNGAPLP